MLISKGLITLELLISTIGGLRSTTYGYGEWMCGPIGHVERCQYGAITSTGMIYDPQKPTAAIYAPTKMRFKPFYLKLRLKGSKGPCHDILINDKGNPRYIGTLALDVSPRTLELLTGKPPRGTWTGRIEVCNE